MEKPKKKFKVIVKTRQIYDGYRVVDKVEHVTWRTGKSAEQVLARYNYVNGYPSYCEGTDYERKTWVEVEEVKPKTVITEPPKPIKIEAPVAPKEIKAKKPEETWVAVDIYQYLAELEAKEQNNNNK